MPTNYFWENEWLPPFLGLAIKLSDELLLESIDCTSEEESAAKLLNQLDMKLFLQDWDAAFLNESLIL